MKTHISRALLSAIIVLASASIIWPFTSAPSHTPITHNLFHSHSSHHPHNSIKEYGRHGDQHPSEKKLDHDILRVMPLYVNSLTPDNSSFSWSAPCFRDTQISLNIVDEETIQIIHTNKDPASLWCSDMYVYNTYTNVMFDIFATSGTHKRTIKVTPEELNQIKITGIQVFEINDQPVNFIIDILHLISLFLGGVGTNPDIPFFGSKPTEVQEVLNVKFIEKAMHVKFERRPDVVVDLDESLIQSGDFLPIIRFAGLDPMIGYGTGSMIGHCAMALRVKGELFVVESQSGWYWPRTGIQINPYKQWVQWAKNAGFHVTWLPLRKEYAEKFDSEAAYNAFLALEGIPYGYHNFIFGWLDTPKNSYPEVLSPEFIGVFFVILEKMSRMASDALFSLPLNRRLGTENLTVAGIAAEAAKRGLTLPDLYSIVEDDSWEYDEGFSLVCSSFVVSMWKAGGLFGNLTVNAVEFTPRDTYQIEFLDPNPEVPESCKQVDPANPFCQIMGKFRMIFPGIGTVKPYDHMNEHCWSEGPEFLRTPAGC